MPVHLRISHFIRHYGPQFYQNELYPTADKIIPWKRFQIFYEAMISSLAVERSNAVNASVLAQSIVNTPKDKYGPVEKELNTLNNEIYGIFQ